MRRHGLPRCTGRDPGHDRPGQPARLPGSAGNRATDHGRRTRRHGQRGPRASRRPGRTRHPATAGHRPDHRLPDRPGSPGVRRYRRAARLPGRPGLHLPFPRVRTGGNPQPGRPRGRVVRRRHRRIATTLVTCALVITSSRRTATGTFSSPVRTAPARGDRPRAGDTTSIPRRCSAATPLPWSDVRWPAQSRAWTPARRSPAACRSSCDHAPPRSRPWRSRPRSTSTAAPG